MIKFNKYNVTCTERKIKSRIMYSLDGRVDKRPCVTLYAKDYENCLDELFPECYENNTDSMTDYFEKGRVTLFEGHPLYDTARQKAEEKLSK